MAIVVGVGGVFLLYWAMNRVVDLLPARFREGVRPYVFVGPALVILAVFLVYPVINTIFISFKDSRATVRGPGQLQVRLHRRQHAPAIRNTFGWIILVPLFAVSIGLAFATLADRLSGRGGREVDDLPADGDLVRRGLDHLAADLQLPARGIRNQHRPAERHHARARPGSRPWLDLQPWNNLFLMVIMVWMQTGFAMVVLSAAIKSIPDEIIEAARIDGASELQVFRRIIVPTILPTIVVVTTYMVINAMKVFDIVFVTCERGDERHGRDRRTDDPLVLPQRHDGRGAAIAVILFVAVDPGDDLEHATVPQRRRHPMSCRADPGAGRQAERRRQASATSAGQGGSSGSRSS